MSDIEIEIIEGIAKMLHSYAFARLCDSTTDPHQATEYPATEEQAVALRAFDPGPGGNWCDSVPGTPDVAYEAARFVWSQCSDALKTYALAAIAASKDSAASKDRLAGNFGRILALDVLGTGTGLQDGNWPDIGGGLDLPEETGLGYSYNEGYDYWWEGSAIRASAKCAGFVAGDESTYPRSDFLWKIDRYGGLEAVANERGESHAG